MRNQAPILFLPNVGALTRADIRRKHDTNATTQVNESAWHIRPATAPVQHVTIPVTAKMPAMTTMPSMATMPMTTMPTVAMMPQVATMPVPITQMHTLSMPSMADLEMMQVH